MSAESSRAARQPVWRAAYFLAALLVVLPLLDLLSQVWPLQPGVIAWRYGFLGFLANNLLTPFLGLVVAGIAAAELENTRLLRVLAVLELIGAVAFALALTFFSLDVLQLRSSVRAQAVAGFRTGAAIAAVKYVCLTIGFGLLAAAELRSSRALGRRFDTARHETDRLIRRVGRRPRAATVTEDPPPLLG